MNRIATDDVMLEAIEIGRRSIARAAGAPQGKSEQDRMFTRLYDKVRETPMWLSTPNGDLYAVEYATEGTFSRPPVVIAAPDGEEHAWAARPLVIVARALAHYGSMVYRFDHLGQGESEGDYEATTWPSRLTDLHAVGPIALRRANRSGG